MSDDNTEATDDQLLQLPPEKLVAMLKDKRKSEANYRTQLRDTEAERDKLAGVVEGHRREAFGEFAKSKNVVDSAVDDVAEKVNVAELLDDNGNLDTSKASAALEDLKGSKPHYFVQPAGSSSVDFSGSAGESQEKQATWADVIG